MSLLNDLFARPLDPGYEEAARELAATDPDAAAKAGKLRFSPALLFGLLALGMLLTIAAMQVRSTASVVSAERESLIERIRTEEAHAADLEANVASLENEVEDLENRQLQNSAAGQQLRDDVQLLQGIAGPTAVEGPGIVVTVDNAPTNEDSSDPELSRVLDIDLQQVVNGLWAAGAEAVSINGQRLTSLTAIRSANDVIQVNYRPMAPPYDVVALGDSRTLGSRFSDGPGGQWLRVLSSSQGMKFSVRSEDSLEVPSISTTLTYAQPKEDS